MVACKGCREIARLVGELEQIRQMMESMKRIVTEQGLEEKGEETGDREAEVGKVRRSDDTRQQFDRRKPEGKGDRESGTHLVRR